MRDAQKPDHVSLNTLLGRMREGRFVIPDFQREFEWNPWDIRDLMRSIFLDYYIGSLLLWRGKRENFEALSCEHLYGFDNARVHLGWSAGSGSPEHIVLDGQQRLTALYYAFIGPDVPLPNRANRAHYYVRVDQFMREEYDEAFQYDWNTYRFQEILNNPEMQFERHIFPLRVIGEGGWGLPDWVRGYTQHWHACHDRAIQENDQIAAGRADRVARDADAFGKHLKSITEQYQIAYIELDRELAVDKVCDIFTQINSRGIRLDVFDLINALLKPKGLQLKHMWRDASKRLDFVDTPKMNAYVLQVMSILLQVYCSPKYLYFLLPGQEKVVRDARGHLSKDVLVPDAAAFQAQWDRAVSALEYAIKLLRQPQEFGAISTEFFPYVSILPVFAALEAVCKGLPPPKQLDAQRKLRHWYWASVFTNRYSGSVESTSARDFLNLKAWMEDDLAEPSLIPEFNDQFRSLDLRREIKKGTSIYNGVFNLLVIQGARDWVTGNVPQYDDLDDHHIVPASWGKAHATETNTNTILNRTPLTAVTNRHVINDQLPNRYLPQLMASSSEGQVKALMESHFISAAAMQILLRDPFEPPDFEAFIAERQRTIQAAIENLLVKERLDLSPQLRELDGQLEATELGLRRLIATTFDNDQGRLPPHIAQKIEERIQRAAKKNAALDINTFQELGARLEYADLRELQDILVSKAGWPDFQPYFSTKEALIAKFGQLAELRNGIRHSRTVDEITRKEGEAAILWFHQVMSR
jgi:hypothetical protein